jgi:O-antigen ligase
VEGGFVGAVSYLLVLGYIFYVAFRKRDRKNSMDFYHIVLYIIPLFLLLNILAAFMFEDLVWILTAMFFAYRRISADDEKDMLNLPKENND